MRVAGVVLAAGAGSRYGGDKLVAPLDGRPLVRHVIDAAVEAGLDPIVVVVPPSGPVGVIDVAPARRVVNPTPQEGLSSSVRIGLRALHDDPAEAAVLLPADQPRVRPDVIRAVIAAATEREEPPFVVARYAADAAPNPVLARREIWRLADELAGDHGFGPLLGAHPELVRDVPVDGANPDVDTRDDLERLSKASAGPGKAASDPGDVS